jgi:hypothetical protein
MVIEWCTRVTYYSQILFSNGVEGVQRTQSSRSSAAAAAAA